MKVNETVEKPMSQSVLWKVFSKSPYKEQVWDITSSSGKSLNLEF
jgi:hypothetical protein